MLSYKKAFELAKDKETRVYKIINHEIYARMKAGGHITTRTIDRLCEALDCQPGDLMEYVPNTKPGD